MSENNELNWRKSTFSGGSANCVEVADTPDGGVLVRDTKQNGKGPILGFAPEEWDAFTADIVGGRFDQA